MDVLSTLLHAWGSLLAHVTAPLASGPAPLPIMEAAPAEIVPLASRQWSCSELQHGMQHVAEEGANPAELAELEVGLRASIENG